MSRVELKIYYKDGSVTKQRAVVNKWKFQDSMMGEQYIMFNITSETPIAWAIGDYCVFRGETFTLNYVPSVTQKARIKERQDSFTYENVKFESQQEELTRCIMLDITPTTGDYIAALGTNYTGSSRFNLFCGETTANGSTLTAVCALAAKIQANLDRMFPTNGWKILVDTISTYIDGSGNPVLVTHTDDKMLSFDNTTVTQALAEVHNTFDLDYCVRGRTIYIGYNLKNLTSDNDDETFAFGYGKGYPTRDDSGKALFQIKRIANSQQKVVTRLRALGSTKNMPYRYYNNKYNLSQSLFPTNLQLPDTFVPEGSKTDSAGTNSKWGHNKQRASYLRAVKGDTNDAYIDKNDDAASCVEGIREESARWDGTNGDLPEIYPTIEEATYGELRSALVQDQDGRTGQNSFPNYGSSERIDSMLAIGYLSDGTLVDDANKGDGILPESGTTGSGIPRSATIGQTTLNYNKRNNGDFTSRGSFYAGVERTLFTIQDVFAGKYAMAPTIGAVIYGFSLSCYKEGISAEVGFQIAIKQKSKNTGTTTTIATYTSDFVSIARADGIKEMELPEIPDVKNGSGAKVSSVTVTELSDITVTFTPIMRNITVPSGFTDNFGLVYKVGNSRLDNTVTYAPEYTWISADGEGNSEETFHVFIKDMGFDITACWTDETPVVAMKSGRCVGREFEIGENVQKVTYNGKQGYMLTLKRATDSSLNTYYPSATDPIAAGDYFVLLNISMPDVYVKMAEVRLLKAATDYLADNCETAFTYQPYIDDIFLQRNYDNMEAAGTPEKSIFWRLYAGLKFTFRGIPTNEEDPLPLADITIAQVSISMGEGLTPKVEITLNDDVQQSTLQKLTTSVDRIYNGSLFSSGGGGAAGTGANSAALMSILQSEGAKQFLSKKNDDTAEGKITFNDVVTHKEALKARKGIKVGEYQSRLLGSGAIIDEEGNAEFESIYSRKFISTPEFRFNRISVTEGEQWCTNGFGTILAVDVIDDTTGYITLKLEENDYASIAEGDICRGIYNDITNRYETASLDDDTELYAGENESNIEGFGFSSKEGFFTSYFWVRQMITNKKGECKFLYELRNTNTPHPCEFMKFAQYGSFTNSDRRSSSYSTSIGHYYEMVLDGVSTWKIKSANVVYRKGYLGNMTVTLKNGKEAELKGYGLYVQDNVYFGNAIVQLDPETLADLQEALNSYTVDFSGYVDVVTVDDVGNIIGGLWVNELDNNNIIYRAYRIHSAITVRKSGNLLVLASDDADAGDGTYKIYAQPKGCSCIIEDSTIYITGIDNIKDGVAGSTDDANFDYAAMRDMDSCSVDIIIDCEGKGSIVKNFPITIKHDSQPFVSADIDNEFSAVSWNTQRQSYVGLPLVVNMRMWHNNETLDVTSIAVNGVQGATKTDSPKHIEVGGIRIRTGVVPVTDNGQTYYVGKIQISELPSDLSLVTNLNITTTALYAGVSYERTLVHTINKSTDTNVYQLLPSVTEVGVGYNDNKQPIISTNKVYCTIRCDSTDDKHYTVATSDYATHGLFITYQTFSLNANDVEVGGAETAYSYLNGVTVTSDLTRIRFKLYKLRDTTLGTLEALLASSNVIEVLDIEDVPVLLDGLDGDNSIFVTLDNANDAVMCIEDGTVIASTLPTARARLMDGEDTVGRSILGTSLATNKQTLGNWSLVCHGCTAEFVGWVADSDENDWVQIRVTGVTDDVASVDVNCEYTKHGVAGNYVSILSVKKIYGLDKYELVFNPPIVSYNPNTDTYTPESFMVYVWKTTQEEDRHLLTSLPGNTSNAVSQQDGSIRLQYSVNKGVSWTTLYGYSSGKSIGKTLFDIDGVESVDFRIQKYVVGESGGEWVLLDEEGVEIVGDGENTVQLTIDNGNDSVMCVEDGTVIASTLPIAQVYLYDGNNLMNNDLATSAWQTLVCDGCTAEWVSGYQSDGGKRFRVTAVTSDVAKVTARVSYKGNTYSVVHNIKKLYGLDKYEIITDPVSIAYNPNSGTHTPTSFNVYVYLTTQEEDRHLMTTLPSHSSATDGDVRLQYSTDNGSNWTTLTGYSSGKTITSSSFSSVTSGSVLLRIQKYVVGESGGEWVLLDEEGVEITSSGLDGKGVEYIFFQQDTETPRPTINDVAANRQVDNYCPYNTAGTQQWTDEPVGIGENSKFEFYAQRKKVNGVWQPFGTVKLWNRYTVDGQSPYMMDLTNEQSFINCDESGNVIGSYETSNLMIFKGNSYAFTDFNIRITPTNVKCNGNSSAFTLTEAQKSTAQSNGYFTLTPSAITANSAQITIQATLKSNTSIVLVAVYKINKNLAGQNGIIYSLIPSLNVIHKNADGTYRDTILNVQVNKIVGSSVIELTTKAQLTAEGIALFYQGSHDTEQEASTLTGLSTSTLCGTALFTKLFLRETNSETLLDSERINVVADGEDGISYIIDANPDSVTIPTDATQATYSGLIKFYKNVADEITPVQWYSVIYVRKLDGTRRFIGGRHTFYGYGSDDSPYTINVTTADDVIEVFCIDEANASNILTDYVIKKEIAIYKNGDTGPEGDDGITYYLTSSINTIIRDSYGDYKGSARPTITAWKKVGANAAVRLNDITTPSVAEGFTINAYEKNGDTTRYTNTSTTGVLTCAEPYSDVDRFEVELVKDGKIYATMSIPIINEVKGDDGNDGAGVYPRDCGLFRQGNTYYYKKEGTMYVRDMVRYEIGGVMYGFMVKDTTVGTTGVTAAPSSSSGDSNWEASGIVETVIANTIFGQNANIGGFMASAEMLRSSTPAYRVRYMGTFKALQYGLYYQGTFQLGTNYYYQYHGYSVYGAVFYNGTYYRRKSSSAPDTTKYPNQDTDHWASFTSADYDCISHPNEEYIIPTGAAYTYSEATDSTPAIRPLVKYNDIYYVAKGNQLGKTFQMSSFSTAYWREAFDFEVGGIQNVGDTVDVPKFMLNGSTGTLTMRQADDTIYTYDEDGKQTTGYEDGRKVVIDPSTKSVSVYNDSGKQVITINGENKSSISSAYTGDSGSTSVASGTVSQSAGSSGCKVAANVIKVLSNKFTIGDGGWNFQIQASLSVAASYTTSKVWCADQDKGVLGYIQPLVYNTGSYGHQSFCKAEIVLIKEGGSTVVLASLGQGANGNYTNISIDKNMHIGSGTYYLALRYTYALYSNHGCSIKYGAITASWAKDGYMGEIFANGLAFGNNAQNFFALIKESDTNLHLKLLSNNKYGIEINNTSIKVCINGTWYTLGVSNGNATLT